MKLHCFSQKCSETAAFTVFQKPKWILKLQFHEVATKTELRLWKYKPSRSYTDVYKTEYARLIDWLSMVLRLRQHNIGYTADGFYGADDTTNSVKALKEGG